MLLGLDPVLSGLRLAELEEMPKLGSKLRQRLIIVQRDVHSYIVARYLLVAFDILAFLKNWKETVDETVCLEMDSNIKP